MQSRTESSETEIHRKKPKSDHHPRNDAYQMESHRTKRERHAFHAERKASTVTVALLTPSRLCQLRAVVVFPWFLPGGVLCFESSPLRHNVGTRSCAQVHSSRSLQQQRPQDAVRNAAGQHQCIASASRPTTAGAHRTPSHRVSEAALLQLVGIRALD